MKTTLMAFGACAFLAGTSVILPAGEGRKMTVPEAVAGTHALLNARKISDVLGVTHVDGLYAFSDKPFLIEGAHKIQELGSKVIKLWFSKKSAESYPWNSQWPEDIRNLVDLARTPYYAEVFDLPFHTYVLEASEFPAKGNATAWKDGLSAEEARVVHDQFHALATHLLKTYQGSGKTFILQNWEGDNALNLKVMKQENWPVAIQGLVDWINLRQGAVEEARKECDVSGVRVLNALEMNWVPSKSETAAGKFKIPLVVDEVVPRTHCDLYSLSSWGTRLPGTEHALKEKLQYIADKAPDNELFGSKNVMLGEFGANESTYEDPRNNHPQWVGNTGGAQFYANKLQLDAALEWGVPYALYWQLYCNGYKGKHSGKKRPDAGKMLAVDQCMGVWLIRADGSHTPTWDYFKALYDLEKG